MPISSGDVVCVLPSYVIVGCTPLSRYSVHQGYILALSSWLNNVFRHQSQSICKCLFVSRPHNISGFEDYWGIAAKFELEDLFQVVIPSSCCDEQLKQQLWIDLYCFVVEFDSCAATLFAAPLTSIYFAVSTFTLMPSLIPVAMIQTVVVTEWVSRLKKLQ